MRIGIAEQLHGYQRQWLPNDVVAAFVVVGLLAPAGVAYAVAAGLPPATGLYATIIPLFVYFLIGPSRVLVIGPDSALTPLVAAAVLPYLATGPDKAVAIAATVSILAGLMCIVAGLVRFGFIAELLSAPVRYGYLQGIALTIVVSQLAKVFGYSAGGESLIPLVEKFVGGLRDHLFNGWACAIGVAAFTVILLVRRIDRRLPATLVAVIVGIVADLVVDFGRHGVHLTGDLPRGIPRPSLPHVGWSTAQGLVGAALGIALVSFADTVVMSRTMALRRHEKVDANRELLALGACNVGCGLFGGFAVSASSTRTPVAEASGARTQVTGLVAGAILLVVAIAAPSAFRHLPEPVLAAIVIAAAMSLIDLPAMRRLWTVRRSEFVLAVGALLAVAVLGPVSGVVVAVALSILNFLRLAWIPHTAELVRVDGLKGYHDRDRHPEGRIIPGLLLYRFDAPLFFANASFFADDVRSRIAARADHVERVIVTAEPITDIDTTAADTITEVLADLRASGIEVHFAELKGTVKDRINRYRAYDDEPPLDERARTVGQAVKDYLAAYPVEWTDWEDRSPGATDGYGGVP